jgi:hypothetical protein
MKLWGIALASLGTLLMLVGAAVALYFALVFDVTVSKYPAYPPDDAATQRIMDETYGRVVSVAKLSDRNAGLTVGLALGLAGVFILTRAQPKQDAGA